MKVKLEDVIDGMEMQFEDSLTLLYKKTGEVISISDDFIRKAEDIEDDEVDQLMEWQQDEMRHAIRFVEDDEDYKVLPTQHDIDEYDMMQRFCYSLDNEDHSDILLQAIQGKGAFRRFKDEIIHLGIDDKWYAFRDERYKQKAIEWCEHHNLEYE